MFDDYCNRVESYLLKRMNDSEKEEFRKDLKKDPLLMELFMWFLESLKDFFSSNEDDVTK